jgi:hypothetical protein
MRDLIWGANWIRRGANDSQHHSEQFGLLEIARTALVVKPGARELSILAMAVLPPFPHGQECVT